MVQAHMECFLKGTRRTAEDKELAAEIASEEIIADENLLQSTRWYEDWRIRYNSVVAAQNLYSPEEIQYKELNALRKSINDELKNNTNTRIELRFENGHYFGVDTKF